MNVAVALGCASVGEQRSGGPPLAPRGNRLQDLVPQAPDTSNGGFGRLSVIEREGRMGPVRDALDRGDDAGALTAAERAVEGLVLDRKRFLDGFAALLRAGQRDRAAHLLSIVVLEAWTVAAREVLVFVGVGLLAACILASAMVFGVGG